MPPPKRGPRKSTADCAVWAPALAVATLALVAVLWTLGPPTGPGITCDEYYDVWAGKCLVEAWRSQGLAFFQNPQIDANFGILTPHPPLGRWLLGWTHWLVDPRPDDPQSVSVVVGRMAPAVAFAAMVFLVGWVTAKSAGVFAGATAAAAAATMPRLFAHAHFATLDTFTALAFVAALVALAEAECRSGRAWQYGLAGVVLGLAMLTKMHGFLLLPLGTAWMLWRRRWSALPAIFAWSLAGMAVFFAGWPWLWPAPFERVADFLGTSTDRQPLNVYYLGQVWADRDAPWHYPWVMFVVTMPLGWLVLGLLGLWAGGRRWLDDPRLSLSAIGWLWVLLVFSWPAAPVYDGVRLFLMALPLWAVMVGVGVAWLCNRRWFARHGDPARWLLVAVLVMTQSIGLVQYHPYWLSYYNLLVGGLRGAERLGFEVTYWGDTVRGPVIDEAVRRAPDSTVWYAPQLAPFQAAAAEASLPELGEAGVTLLGWDAGKLPHDRPRYAIVYHRKAELDSIAPLIAGGRVVSENARQGVWLARLYDLDPQ